MSEKKTKKEAEVAKTIESFLEFIKVAVVNNSGNVGKSTLCHNLFIPRMPKAELIKVETINSDGTLDETLSANEFTEIFKRADSADCAIVDVGASNIEAFMHKLEEHKGSHEDFDLYVVPVTPPHKQQFDSVSTIENLLDLGVSPENIRVVFNQVDKETPIEKQFSNFLNSKLGGVDTSIRPIVYFNEIYSHLNRLGKTFDEVLNDNRDFKKLIRESSSREERQKLSEEKNIQRLVLGTKEELDIAFQTLFSNF